MTPHTLEQAPRVSRPDNFRLAPTERIEALLVEGHLAECRSVSSPVCCSKQTNSEALVKQAGTNRDIVYFQCYDECRISNQIFKAKKGYKYVQVTRELPDNRPAPLS